MAQSNDQKFLLFYPKILSNSIMLSPTTDTGLCSASFLFFRRLAIPQPFEEIEFACHGMKPFTGTIGRFQFERWNNWIILNIMMKSPDFFSFLFFPFPSPSGPLKIQHKRPILVDARANQRGDWTVPQSHVSAHAAAGCEPEAKKVFPKRVGVSIVLHFKLRIFRIFTTMGIGIGRAVCGGFPAGSHPAKIREAPCPPQESPRTWFRYHPLGNPFYSF